MARTPGSISRRSLTVGELCKKLKFNPVQELLELKNKTFVSVDKEGNQVVVVGIEPSLYAKICLDLMPYIYPKLSSVQVTGNDGGPVGLNVTAGPDIHALLEGLIRKTNGEGIGGPPDPMPE